MNPTPTQPPSEAATRTAAPIFAPIFARRFAAILAEIGALVAARFLRKPHLAPLVVPLWNYLSRVARRAQRLMARLASGRLPRPSRPRPIEAGRAAPADSPASPRGKPFPTSRAWLIHAIPYEAACFAGQLRILLEDPATPALLAAAPTTVRLLRPLCHMLGIDLGRHLGLPDPAPHAAKPALPVPPAAPPERAAPPPRKPPSRAPDPRPPAPAAPWPCTAHSSSHWLMHRPPPRIRA